MKKVRFLLLCLFVLGFLVGCAGDAPKLIAAFPSGNEQGVLAPPRPPVPGVKPVYYAFLALEVSDPERVAEKAEGLTYAHGGYLVRSDSWYREGRQQVTLVLAVPMPDFERLRDALTRLGKLGNERVWGDWLQVGPGSTPYYAEITLQLQARKFAWPSLPFTGWDPGRTLGRAFQVFLSIFGFLVDILIWVAVVVGPFALLGWLAWRLLKRITAGPPR